MNKIIFYYDTKSQKLLVRSLVLVVVVAVNIVSKIQNPFCIDIGGEIDDINRNSIIECNGFVRISSKGFGGCVVVYVAIEARESFEQSSGVL